jgi:hypothetical protein
MNDSPKPVKGTQGPPSEPRRLWHMALSRLVSELAPPGVEVLADQPLGIEPQRMDLLILRRRDVPRHDEEAHILRGLWKHLPEDTIVEFKSLRRPVAPGDASKLLGYGAAYFAQAVERLPRLEQLSLVLLVVSVTPTLEQELARMHWTLHALGDGYFEVKGTQFSTWLAVIDSVSRAEHDALLDSLGRGKMIDAGVAAWWSEHMLNIPEVMQLMYTQRTSEEAMEVLRRLPPEVRRQLIDRDVVKLMTVEERLAGLRPEERLADLSPEERLLLNPPEVLRQLSKEYVASLSPHVREEIDRILRTH